MRERIEPDRSSGIEFQPFHWDIRESGDFLVPVQSTVNRRIDTDIGTHVDAVRIGGMYRHRSRWHRRQDVHTRPRPRGPACAAVRRTVDRNSAERSIRRPGVVRIRRIPGHSGHGHRSRPGEGPVRRTGRR